MEGNPLQKGRSLEDHEHLRIDKEKKKCCTPYKCVKITAGTVFTLSLALCCVVWFTSLYWYLIRLRVTIDTSNQMYPNWVATPLTTKNCITLFNYTNVPEFMAKQHPTLKIERVGPICFREQPLKENIVFKSGGLVDYDDSRTLKLWPEETKVNLSDTVTMPNVAFLSTITLSTDFMPTFQNLLLSFIPKNSSNLTPFLTMNISDYVMGWDDDIHNAVTTAAAPLGITLPFNQSGVVPWMAGFLKVRMTAETGHRNTQRIGKLTQINGQPRLRLWESKDCNTLKGSDGIYFPPNDVRAGNPIYFYFVLLCRSIKLTKLKEVELQEGLMVPRYVMEEKTLAAPARNPENACYCRKKGYCYNTTEGLAPFDLKPCLGIPLLLTSPNMNLYPKSLLTHLEGYEMNVTDPHDFDTYFDVLPNLGITVRYMQNGQINLRVGKVRQFANVLPNWGNDRMLPMYYFQRTGDNLPKVNFKTMYDAQVVFADIEFLLKWLFLTTAFLSGLVCAYLISRTRIAKKAEAKFALK
ncbi:unnamed protein product [Bemisia tabaci]|uniref:Scavenger receptor class B member 1 n=1 Tax=Bemisia tabaci TaxID=7038 RepID=A0A9P0EXP5_BEMTA|nr:unnamed protein product [Bemisia tabaci]